MKNNYNNDDRSNYSTETNDDENRSNSKNNKNDNSNYKNNKKIIVIKRKVEIDNNNTIKKRISVSKL